MTPDTDAQLETAHDGSLAGVEQENPYDETMVAQIDEKVIEGVGT